MATSKETMDFLRDALALVPEVSFRPMMGGHCVYSSGRVFALVCDDMLFLKTTPETLPLFSDQNTRAYPGSRNTAQANAEWLEDREKLAEVVSRTLRSLPAPKPQKPGKPRRSGPAGKKLRKG